jgi:hypothetical protein
MIILQWDVVMVPSLEHVASMTQNILDAKWPLPLV